MRKRIIRVLLVAFCLFFCVLPLLGLLAYRIADRTNGTLVVNGEKRRYLLYVPPSYDATQPTALIISLHGFSQWPANQSEVTHWHRLANVYGVIVVHPSGTGFPKRWRAIGAEAAQQPDVAFLAALITHLESQYAIDPRRIYVNGLSNGAGMSFLLSCALADRIAAWGGVGGAYAYPWEACAPSRPVPAIFFHGEIDPIVPYHGGVESRGGWTLPEIPVWVDTYAERNGCALPGEEERVSAHVTRRTYRKCAADVVFYRIADGGHTWPGGDALPVFITGPTNREIDATQMMWDFFAAHPLIP